MDDRGTALADFVGDALARRAGAVARRWGERAIAAAPRVAPAAGLASGADAERVVGALAGGLHKDACWQGEVMRLGWAAGTVAHGAGTSAHHLLKEVDLLLAVVLAEVEQLLAGAGDPADAPPPLSSTSADGVAVARRLQRAAAMFAESAAAGYLHAFVEQVRTRWRTLRHDLRNPLGTIRGALSLMEDEALPLEARTGPRMRDMLARNAGSMERLIGAGLGDEAPRTLLAAADPIPLRDLALAVRRAVREPAELAGCAVEVGDAPTAAMARLDAGAAELALTAVLLAGVQGAARGDRFVVGARVDGTTVAFTVAAGRASRADGDPSASWRRGGIELGEMLAEEAGGGVRLDDDVVRLELPCVPARPERRERRAADARADARAADVAPRRASGVEACDDVGRAD